MIYVCAGTISMLSEYVVILRQFIADESGLVNRHQMRINPECSMCYFVERSNRSLLFMQASISQTLQGGHKAELLGELSLQKNPGFPDQNELDKLIG